jgi:rare lipoprotein A
MKRLAVVLALCSMATAAWCPVPVWQAGAPAAPAQVTATWYGRALHGHLTAWHFHGNPGYRFDAWAPCAAHNTLPLGSWVMVRFAQTGRSLAVQIVDRGPTAPGVDIDLSEGAALQLGYRALGKVTLEMEVIP